MRAKAVTTLVVTAVCLAVAGGFAAEHRSGGLPEHEPVSSQTQDAPVSQLGPQLGSQGVAPASGVTHDVFDNVSAAAH